MVSVELECAAHEAVTALEMAHDAMCQATFNLNGRNCGDLNDAIPRVRAAMRRLRVAYEAHLAEKK